MLFGVPHHNDRILHPKTLFDFEGPYIRYMASLGNQGTSKPASAEAKTSCSEVGSGVGCGGLGVKGFRI